jgi:hypothetical protein
MKSIILFALLAVFSIATFAQVKSNPNKKTKPSAAVKVDAADSTETYVFKKSQAIYLYKALEDYKHFIAMSDEVTAGQANKLYIPRVDSIEHILRKQAEAYQVKQKPVTDSLTQTKVKQDSLKAKKSK